MNQIAFSQRLIATVLGMTLGLLLVCVILLGQINSKINQHPTVLIKCATGTQCNQVTK